MKGLEMGWDAPSGLFLGGWVPGPLAQADVSGAVGAGGGCGGERMVWG
jgi:hypothetical protein